MANISAAQVKELREKTGVGMMDAKKALVATDGDMDKAVDELRERGVIKAAKKSDKIAAEGLAYISIDGNTAAVIEVNSETDFVSENDKFKTLVKDIGDTIVKEKPLNIDDAKVLKMGEGTIQDAITNLSAVIGEKIELRRISLIEKTDSQVYGTYTHNGGAIASLAVVDGSDEETAKDVAMHVAAVNPKFTTRDEVPEKVSIHEKEVLTEETKNEGKPENIIPKIVEGRMNKFYSEICLADQEFIKDSDKTVEQYVESKGGKLVTFERYEVGEGIEKPKEDFAEEVKNQMK